MKTRFIPLILLFLIIISGCSPKVHLTQDVRIQLEENNIDLKDVQFYIDRRLVLRNEISSNDVKLEEGAVKIEKGRKVDEIVFRRFTPGVCVSYNADNLVIAFENDSSKTLSFGNQPVVYPVKTAIYQVQANKWSKSFGKVNYGGEVYYITPEGSEAQLLISKNELQKSTFNKKVIKGVKVIKE